MRIISFYTDDGLYPTHAERLRRECESLGLEHRIEMLPNTGSYLRNCCLKPSFIQQCLKDEKGPVLWLDVDASIYARPDFFSDDDPFDFQARRMGPQRKRTWHVGTMWWNHTPQALEFVDRWVQNTGECSDESALEFTWRQGHELRTRDIPYSYFRYATEPVDGVVIAHRLSTGESKRSESAFAINYEQTVI